MLTYMRINPICTPPQTSEIEARISRVRDSMATAGLEAIILHNPENIFYLTNFANMVHERPFILVISLAGPPVFIVPRLEVPHVLARSVGTIQITEYREFPAKHGETWHDSMRKVTENFNRFGIENDAPYYVVSAVDGKTQVCEIVEESRAIKSDYEISRHQYASDLMTLGLMEVLKLSVPGAFPLAIHGAAGSKMYGKMFGDLPSTNLFATKFNAAPQPQPLSHDPHNFTDLFCPLAVGGPHVALAAGKANGYGAEIERTFFIDKVPANAIRPFQYMMEARALAIDLIKPGAVMNDVDAAVNSLLTKAGYSDNLLHRTGHGFGVTDHEGPFLAEGDYRVIKPGMLFSVEPGIYLPGIGGFRHSDTVLVTEQGCQLLTSHPDSLSDMTLNS